MHIDKRTVSGNSNLELSIYSCGNQFGANAERLHSLGTSRVFVHTQNLTMVKSPTTRELRMVSPTCMFVHGPENEKN